MNSSMSPTRRSNNYRDVMGKERTNFGAIKEEDLVEISKASDRKRRRHEQASLEADKAR